jgi:hypothetical protein
MATQNAQLSRRSQSVNTIAAMPTFIDESGDTGWKPGSLPYFRLCAAWLPTPEDVEACRESISACRKALRLPQSFEFKFATTQSQRQRCETFFRAVIRHPFRFVVCAYDKQRLEPGSLQPRDFHHGTGVVLATELRACYLEAERGKTKARGKPASLDELVVVDNNQDKSFLNEIKKSFRAMQSGTRAGGKLVGKVKFRGSRPDEMLQLADMLVGAAGRHLENDSTWLDMVRSQCLGIIRLP